jgi:hypothetical protein
MGIVTTPEYLGLKNFKARYVLKNKTPIFSFCRKLMEALGG